MVVTVYQVFGAESLPYHEGVTVGLSTDYGIIYGVKIARNNLDQFNSDLAHRRSIAIKYNDDDSRLEVVDCIRS